MHKSSMSVWVQQHRYWLWNKYSWLSAGIVVSCWSIDSDGLCKWAFLPFMFFFLGRMNVLSFMWWHIKNSPFGWIINLPSKQSQFIACAHNFLITLAVCVSVRERTWSMERISYFTRWKRYGFVFFLFKRWFLGFATCPCRWIETSFTKSLPLCLLLSFTVCDKVCKD